MARLWQGFKVCLVLQHWHSVDNGIAVANDATVGNKRPVDNACWLDTAISWATTCLPEQQQWY